MARMFVNRDKERALLDKEVQRARVLVLYGRRRVGKTKLLTEWGQKYNLIYTQAIEAAENIQLNQIYEDLREHFPIEVVPHSWNELLHLLTSLKGKSVLAIDEFPYLVESNPSLPSLLQRWVDHEQPDDLLLILLGSSRSMMHGLFLDSASPLYGRVSRILHIEPMHYRDFTEYLSIDHTKRDSFIKYSVTGGIPKYWEYVDPDQKAIDFIEDLFFSDFSYFENEPNMILRDEKIGGLQPVSILEAIGRGASKPSEISRRIGVRQTDIGRSLQALLDSSLIIRELPFGESVRSTKRVLYHISDHALRFWYNVYSPHRTRWHLYSKAKKESLIFGHAAMILEKELRNLYPDAARYWEGGGIELDSVRYLDDSGKTLVISEVKWRTLDTNARRSILADTEAKYERSELAKRHRKAVFEVLSFDDIVHLLE